MTQITGNITALVTPMHIDGLIDFEALTVLLQRQVEQAVSAVLIMGTTGESPTLTADERKQLIQHSVKVIDKRIPVIVGAGANSTAVTIEYVEQAKQLGADATLLVTPYYNKPTQEGLFQHYRAIASAVSLPQIIYNVPGRTGCDLQPETLQRLSGFSTIVGLKECEGGIERLKTHRSLCGDRFAIYTGNDDNIAEFVAAGGSGCVSVLANIVPNLVNRLCDYALHDVEQARQLQRQLADLVTALFIESNPIPVKYCLAEMNLISAGIRLPLTWLDLRYQTQLKQALIQLTEYQQEIVI